MLTLQFRKEEFFFKQPAGTSRGVLQSKESWILELWDRDRPSQRGIGEVSILPGLSPDPRNEIENKLSWLQDHLQHPLDELLQALSDFPAIQFALETAFLSYKARDPFTLIDSAFTRGEAGIPINGLIWMGDVAFMHRQLEEKLAAGYTCIKIKVGAIKHEEELAMVQSLRKRYSASAISIRLDANGAYTAYDAVQKLEDFAKYDIHSIEQPVKPGNRELMAELCRKKIIPIALDEELIGITDGEHKEELLQSLSPQYLILKPSLLGGLSAADEWIRIAGQQNIGWWATSALESNIALNAIAQWVAVKGNNLPQGLGTGQLFTHNFDTGLYISGGKLFKKQKAQ